MPKSKAAEPGLSKDRAPAGTAKDAVVPMQGDLFSMDSPLRGGVHGELSLMAYPFFALTKQAWMKPLAYSTGEISIEVQPGHKGVANIYDKEVILYIASLMAAKIENGEPVSQNFQFTANDFFRVTGATPSSNAYTRLYEALERLQSTQIKTDIETGGEGEAGFFSWVETARLQYTKTRTGERRLKAVNVRLCDWLFRAILKDRSVMQYAPSYFQLSPINRRLYEVACFLRFSGVTSIRLGDLQHQIGHQSLTRLFKPYVVEAANGTVPGFEFSIQAAEGASKSSKVSDEVVVIREVPTVLATMKRSKAASEN